MALLLGVCVKVFAVGARLSHVCLVASLSLFIVGLLLDGFHVVHNLDAAPCGCLVSVFVLRMLVFRFMHHVVITTFVCVLVDGHSSHLSHFAPSFSLRSHYHHLSLRVSVVSHCDYVRRFHVPLRRFFHCALVAVSQFSRCCLTSMVAMFGGSCISEALS